VEVGKVNMAKWNKANQGQYTSPGVRRVLDQHHMHMEVLGIEVLFNRVGLMNDMKLRDPPMWFGCCGGLLRCGKAHACVFGSLLLPV
jgi:hypothetical protein